MGAGQQSVQSWSDDQIYGGSGTDTIQAIGGGVSIWCGSGATSVSVCDYVSTDTTTVYGGYGSATLSASYDALTFIGGSGSAVINGMGGSMYIVGGSGSLTVSGGGAPTTFIGGAGDATVGLSSLGGSVQFGSGTTTINAAGWGAVDSFTFLSGHAPAADLIKNFRAGTDKLILSGVTVASETVSGGSANLVFSDNSTLTLAGVTNLTHLFS